MYEAHRSGYLLCLINAVAIALITVRMVVSLPWYGHMASAKLAMW